MPRPLRLQLPDGLYHITTRGNCGRTGFENDGERQQFLDLLGVTVERCGWSCRSYCVLSTHYHLLVLTPEPDIAAGMQYLNGRFGQWANWNRSQRGHLFEGRYRSVLIESDAHLLEVYRYIALNPVRAGLVRDPVDWPWSSLGAVLGRSAAPELLDVTAALADFGRSVGAARRRLRLFIQDGVEQDRR